MIRAAVEAMLGNMSGPRRLAVFLSGAWVSIVGVGAAVSDGPGVGFFVGVVPVALVWGVAWVWAGFRAGRPSAANPPEKPVDPLNSSSTHPIEGPSRPTRPSWLSMILGSFLSILAAFPDLMAGDIPEGLGVLTNGLLAALFAWMLFGTRKKWREFSYAFASLALLFLSLSAQNRKTARLGPGALSRIADANNQGLPRMMNADVEFRRAAVAGGVLVFEYRLVKYTLDGISHSPGEAEVAKARQAACALALLRDQVLSHKTGVRLSYFDATGAPLYDVDISPSHCGL